MHKAFSEQLRYQIRYPGLPLAVYLEVAAHLQQVQGVEAVLIPSPQEQRFDYTQSQADGLWISYTGVTQSADRERIDQILTYYQNRYGVWEIETSQALP
ncbi:hypothetical protein [Lyngbya aestuarii]|uniref:hypothetical protein n=1 Tax=Lyngbya aestuarii TaxID=118322 RepID=UPI00403DE4F0